MMKSDNILEDASFEKVKEMGNIAFKKHDWDQALSLYTKALKLCENDSQSQVCLKNRVAAYLKLEKYEEAIIDATSVLEKSPNDPKALYRRCQALEKLNRIEEAYRDARHILLSDPGNKEIQPVLAKLYQKVQERGKINSDINNKISRMFEIVFNTTIDENKRETAATNIVVLAREPGGCKALYESNIIDKLSSTLKLEKNINIRITFYQILNELFGDLERTKSVIKRLGIPWLFDQLNSNVETEVQWCAICIQRVIDVFSGKKDDMCDDEICEKNRQEIDKILTCLVYSCDSRTYTGLARDAIIKLITSNVHFRCIDWSLRLVQIKGIQKLLEVAGECDELKSESSMNLTKKTRSLVAACLARVYENMYYDKARQDFIENVDDFFKSKLITPSRDACIRVTVVVNTLLSGPLEVGNHVLSKNGVMEMILSMADSEDIVQQRIASECIVASIYKQNQAEYIVSRGITVLKKLYESKDEAIRIRALVGLCKVASAGGTDASVKLFAEGSSKKMAQICKKYLTGGSDIEIRRWAAEGFAYLSFDAEIKEMLIEDEPAIRALIEVAKSTNDCVQTSTTYAIINIFVNMCNAYEKKEILPEMIELAKFAKRHIPEEHEFDDPDFVTKRVLTLGRLGMTTALIALSETIEESENSRELISRIFNALCALPEVRGLVVQQGGVKVLIKMAIDKKNITENGKRHASQALARIGITMNPVVAFPGQRCMEVVRPLIYLLHPDCPALMNFEALLALCNLASIDEQIRERIFAEKGVLRIESYMYEDHEHLVRAATQCITNLAMSPKMVELYEGDNDKLKFLYLLCGDEDEETCKAACGALAILTSVSTKCCGKIFTTNEWFEVFKQILAHPSADVRLRAVAIAHNIIQSDKEHAETLLQSQVMEILMALAMTKDDEQSLIKIKNNAIECLKSAEQLKIIMKAGHESDNNGNEKNL